jgi:hypothetical protein
LNEGSLQAAKETLGAGSLALRADVSNLTDLGRDVSGVGGSGQRERIRWAESESSASKRDIGVTETSPVPTMITEVRVGGNPAME